jgi:hypothetical protein
MRLGASGIFEQSIKIRFRNYWTSTLSCMPAASVAARIAARTADCITGKTRIEVDGVRLHYSDRGAGQPVVLVHGNAVAGDDWNTSGVADLLLRDGHRVIAFDRPGFGHSGRPRGRAWTAT